MAEIVLGLHLNDVVTIEIVSSLIVTFMKYELTDAWLRFVEVGYCTYSIVSDTNRMKAISRFRIRRITHEIRTNLFENSGFAGERELKFLNRTQGFNGDSASSSYVTIRFLDKVR